jgi:hypothetical protein
MNAFFHLEKFWQVELSLVREWQKLLGGRHRVKKREGKTAKLLMVTIALLMIFYDITYNV